MVTTILTVAAICFRNDRGELLTVRKRGTSALMLPGGKLETGESPAAAAIREVHEELGLVVRVEDLTPLGTWSSPAANEPDTVIQSTVFCAPLPAVPSPAAEIEELFWLPLDVDASGDFVEPQFGTDGSLRLAPMLRNNAVPALLARA